MSPTIHAAPARAATDTPVDIRLTGFRPREVIRIHAEVAPGNGVVMASQADFLADAAGSVDLAEAVPLFGSYRNADAAGLIWSLAPMPHATRTPTASRYVESGLAPYRIALRAEGSLGSRAEGAITRLPVADGIRRIPLREGGLVGTLFLPPESTRPARGFPGLITVPGSTGGIPENIAALYAAQGWAALALGYFNAGEDDTLPTELVEIPLEYFDRAADWLQSHPELHPETLVIDGVSRGGELALLLAATFPRFRAAIAWVPAAHVHRGFSRDPARQNSSAWTRASIPLPHVPPRRTGVAPRAVDLQNGVPVTHLEDLRHFAEHDGFAEAAIPVEQITGPVLLLSGREDVMWPSASYADWVVDRLRDKGFTHPVTHLSYAGAGHSIGPPFGPATLIGSYEGQAPLPYLYGGTPQGIAIARAALWPEVKAFLRRLA